MHHLRKIYDKTKEDAKQKQKDIDKVDAELEQLDTQAQLAEGDTSALTRRMEQLSGAIQNTVTNQDTELLSQRTYESIMVRMRQSLLMIKIQNQKCEESLNSKAKILEEEHGKEIKNKEQMKQSQNVLKSLMDHVDKDNKNRSERIEGLRRTIHNKEDAVSRRLDRLQRQKDIVEKAADNQEQSEVKLRENLLVQKFWNSFLKRKMEKEMVDNAQIEDAFQKIRTATGISDIQEIMKKFVSREQTYSQLLTLVGENERKLQESKARNKELTDKLNQVRIANAEGTSVEGSFEVEELEKELELSQHELKKVSIKHQSTKIVLEQLNEWAIKIIKKVTNILTKSKCDDLLKLVPSTEKATSIDLMNNLASLIEQMHKSLGFKGVDSKYDIKHLALNMYCQDFERFIRVKPRTKSAHKSDDGQSQARRSSYGEVEDNAEKESREINVEIEEERRKLKKRDEEYADIMKTEKKEKKIFKKKEEEEPKEDTK